MTPILSVIDPYILVFSAITVFVTIFMGFWSAKKSKTASDFFVAGRSVSVGWNASAISGEYLSAASFMGIAGMVMSSGYDALWYPVCYACGYLFLLLFIAGPLRRFGAYTIPDFAEGRFDSPVFRKIAVIFVLCIGFFYTMPQMKGAGTTLAYIFPGLPYWAGVVLVGAVITLNVALGGMKGITLVQAFQYWAKMFAISVPIFVLMAVYGHYGKQLGANGNIEPSTSNFQQPAAQSATIVRHPQNYQIWNAPKISAVNGESDFATLALYKAKQQFGNWLGEEILAASLNQGSAVDVFNSYLEFANQDAYVDGALQRVAARFDLDLDKARSRREHMEYIEQTLRTNSVMNVVRLDGAIYFVFATNVVWSSTKVGPVVSGTTVIPVSTSMSITAVDGWATLKSPGLVDRVEREIAEMRGQGKPFVSLGNAKMVSVLFDLAKYEGRDVVAHIHLDLTRMLGNLVVNATNRLDASAQLRTFLESRDVALFDDPHGRIRAVPKAEEAALRGEIQRPSTDVIARVALPEKAPADETWLSPFGPLTTKAAKAANLSDEEAKPYSLIYTYSLIIALVCGTAGLPHILVRFYTNPDGVAAKRTTMWVMILIGIFYVFPPVFGVMGRNLFPELYSGLGAKGTDKIVLELPRLLNEKYAPLGSILSGITCAGAFAAFMSTFSGLLVSMTGALAHDVYGRMLRPKATPEQRMRMFKVAAVIIGGVAVVLGSFVETLEINFMVGQAFAIAAASYFPLLFMSVWWRKLTMRGAAVGMLAGGVTAVIAISLTSFSNLAAAPGKTGELFSAFQPLNDYWLAHPLMRILCEQPAIWAVPLAITLMIVVSKLTSSEIPKDVRMKMLVLHAPEKLGLKQEYIQEHQAGH